VLKQRIFWPAIRPTQFNYPIDILGKWQWEPLSFVQRYRSGQRETRVRNSTARSLAWTGMSRDRFDIQWHGTRELGLPLCGLSLAKAFEDHRNRWAIAPLMACPLSQ